MSKLKLGITIGDINGVSVEVIIKALSDERMLNQFTPIIYGSSKVLSYHKNIVDSENFHFTSISKAEASKYNRVNVLNCWDETANIELGRATEEAGKFAHIALDRAVRDFQNNQIDGIVTAPINKQAMKMANFPFPGHTEFIADKFKSANSLMMMVSESLKVALVTNHEPITKVASLITKETVTKKLNILHRTLVQDFGIEKPIIAVLGLNPHAGDDGAIGTEDDTEVRPAIIEAKKNGMSIMGPYPADGFFGSSQFKKFDAILAMYHDQGLIPFKSLSFGQGVNFTAGLPLVRTSPDHGTAYDIAGKNIADESSIRSAIFRAIDIARTRKEYHESRENQLERTNRSKKEYKGNN
ncbi:MAG: 4-hydroxythreonine-4-phosphate dehydrogenase PdxA [Saprospiraceae bacterium]|nr:4-hydroxythreonine-4-phosphate dehydrogenase PdxA [Saprospiraceae bacterium]